MNYYLERFPHSETLKKAIKEGKRAEAMYGFFTGGDPRDFYPDDECCNEKEIERWKEAVRQWNEGEQEEYPGSHRWIRNENGEVIGHGTVATFGIGVYLYIDDSDEWEEES
jgi:uncharacterized protein YecE (DUF72 family)